MHFQSDTKVGFATCARWRQRRRDLPANDHGPDNKTVWKNIQSEADTAENLNQYFAHVLSLSLSLSLSLPPLSLSYPATTYLSRHGRFDISGSVR